MSSWEERMAAKAKIRREYEEALQFEEMVTERKLAEPWRYDPTPPDDGECRICYEWRQFPGIQAHFGYAWWRVCQHKTCDHAHHDNEIWFATG